MCWRTSVASAADTWWVDDDNYGKPGMTGAEDAAFGTIQEAVKKAASGDTIKVKPGRYDQGVTHDGYQNSRVVIKDKYVIIEGTGSREDTFLVGHRSASASGFGDDAVRCIYAENAAGTRIRNMTIQDGCSAEDVGNPRGQGGGLYAGSMNANVFMIDCTISNCLSRGGSTMQGGGAIRCLIAGNVRKSGSNGCISRNGIVVNCLCINNDLGGQPAIQGGFAVNCTFFGNGPGGLASELSYLRNCLAFLNDNNLGGDSSQYNDLRHSVFCGKALYGPTSKQTEGLVTNASPYQLFAPAFGDCRPLAGSLAATNGLADILTDRFDVYGIPLDEAFLDFEKKPIPMSGPIACGCIQTIAPAPTCGAVAFKAGAFLTLGQTAKVDGLYAYPADGLKMMHFDKRQFAKGRGHVMWYWLDSDLWYNFRPLLLDDTFYVMPPACPDAVLTVGLTPAAVAFYVDQKAGSDTDNDGLSSEKPFKSIRKALEETPSDGTATVIYVAEGLYDEANEGTSTAMNFNTRVAIDINKRVRIKGAGKGLSIIEGKKDDCATTDKDAPGCGPNACRCVGECAPSGGTTREHLVQGFTLRYGRTALNATGDSSAYSGASAAFSNNFNLMSDNRVEDCKTGRAIQNNGMLFRTEFVDCYGWNGGLRGVKCVLSCSFVDTPGSGAGGVIYGDTSYYAISHCSGVVSKGSGTDVWGGADVLTFNSAFVRGSGVAANAKHFGCEVWDYRTMPTDPPYVCADPDFVSDTDLRPFAGSPVFTRGAALVGDNDYTRNYHLWAVGDVDGNPIEVGADRRPVIGAYQRAVTKLKVTSPSLGSVEPSGVRALTPGEEVTVTYTPDKDHPTRPYLGIAVNGEVKTSGTSWKVTAPGADEAPAAFDVMPMAETNWYVNANAEDDGGDGWTPETAKKKLSSVMACDLLPGDVVHAAAGDYDDGDMYYAEDASATGITHSRVVLPEGVTLVSDEGADRTRIVGENGENPNSFGRGTGALRCVTMRKNATLRGFTLFNGNASLGNESGPSEDRDGGGVLTLSSANSTAVIYDCVITNCAANRGGGAMNGRFWNCRFYWNASIGSGQGDASRSAEYHGCYLGVQRSSNGSQSVQGVVENTTFDGTGANNLTSRIFRNCIFRNFDSVTTGSATPTIGPASGYAPKFYNCIFDSENAYTWTNRLTDAGVVFDHCRFVPLAELQFEDGIPVKGHCAAIDAADMTLVSVQSLENRDAHGNPRVSNGNLDVGACEYDWRPDYAAALGAGVAVETASPGVTLDKTTGKVKLVDGAALIGTWPTQSETRRARYAVTAEASGEGALSGELVCEGKVDEAFALTDASETRKFRATGADIDFAFGFAGEGYGLLSDFSQVVPGTLLFIR